MSTRDPYAMHALLLVYGCDRAEIVRKLREHADAIESGDDGRFSTMPGAEGACTLRASNSDAGEEAAGACRMHAVYDDDWNPSEPIALFFIEEMAARFARGEPPYEPGEERNLEGGVVRADVVLSVWNSVDPDPYARREERGAA